MNTPELDELGIAQAMVAGELTSPQRYGNMMLLAIRITGTGLAYRGAHKEYVWRDPSLYMTPEFLQRCCGLPVIFEHPAKAILNTEEFRKRIVGTVFLPYFRGDDEVWAIAKIYHTGIAAKLETEAASTSPGVMFLMNDPGVKVETPDGTPLLIENKPDLLDHVALLIPYDDEDGGTDGAGVWDKGGPPSGVDAGPRPDIDSDADNRGDEFMFEDEEKDEAESAESTRGRMQPCNYSGKRRLGVSRRNAGGL